MKIRWTAIAADDLKSVHEYLSEHAPARADAIVDRILAGIDALEQYPNLGRRGRLDETRELVITGTPFIVFYRLRKSQVEILGVLHASGLTPSEARTLHLASRAGRFFALLRISAGEWP